MAITYTKQDFDEKDIELVKLEMGGTALFRCKRCAMQWSVEIAKNGLLPLRYWKCPDGCNWLVEWFHKMYPNIREQYGVWVLYTKTGSHDEIEISCGQCDQHWTVQVLSERKPNRGMRYWLASEWWLCPNGCNSDGINTAAGIDRS